MKTRTAFTMAAGVAVVAVIASLHISSNGLWLSTKIKAKPHDPLNIEFQVAEDDSGELILKLKNPACRVKTDNSCFKVKKGYRGVVKFIFDGHDDYRLSMFQICKGLSEKKEDCSLDLAERLDFFVSDDDEGSNVYMTNKNGQIDLSKLVPKASGKTEFYMIDQNTIRSNYFYTIYACYPVNSTNCITTDPPIVNKGRN